MVGSVWGGGGSSLLQNAINLFSSAHRRWDSVRLGFRGVKWYKLIIVAVLIPLQTKSWAWDLRIFSRIKSFSFHYILTTKNGSELSDPLSSVFPAGIYRLPSWFLRSQLAVTVGVAVTSTLWENRFINRFIVITEFWMFTTRESAGKPRTSSWPGLLWAHVHVSNGIHWNTRQTGDSRIGPVLILFMENPSKRLETFWRLHIIVSPL